MAGRVKAGTIVLVGDRLVRVHSFAESLDCYSVAGIVHEVGRWAARDVIEEARVPARDERPLLEATERAELRIERCHEEVACPKCSAPIGLRCRRMPRGFSATYERRGLAQPSAVLKHPHRERWTKVVAAR